MGSVLQFHNHRLFKPADADAMGAAFDAAWESVQQSGIVFGSKEERDQVRELLAFRIIDTAARGEFNPLRLQDDALACLARQQDPGRLGDRRSAARGDAISIPPGNDLERIPEAGVDSAFGADPGQSRAG